MGGSYMGVRYTLYKTNKIWYNMHNCVFENNPYIVCNYANWENEKGNLDEKQNNIFNCSTSF